MEIPTWIELKRGVVKERLEYGEKGMAVVRLEIDHPCKLAVVYLPLTGGVDVGDEVLVNTTACSLGLGTGGYHFVVCNFNMKDSLFVSKGHGMKLKYTPLQMQLLLSEEEESPYHNYYNQPIDFQGKLVYVGELHSMLPPLCAYLKYFSGRSISIAYVMTDHGALPITFSRNVTLLKNKKLLDVTVTSGNAFGGDFECVNIYTALKAALNVAGCDVAVVTMGPGILGTGTTFGFSGLELGLYVNLIAALGGRVVYIPRIGFNDVRERHRGISHHSITVLRDIIQYPLTLVLPLMDKPRQRAVIKQLKANGLLAKYTTAFLSGRDMRKAMEYYQLDSTTMGKSIDEEPYFFYAIGAAARYGLTNWRS
ncbi:hypothetical protein JOD02_000136 [Caldicoprobacter guelmensis]|uniref:DUF3866 family protein n=1 Tax=Caldicoprobacter guelmensis TaxID=1170224 RepID=UPI00195D02C1|nr:DUF3866 family protein [Caldicoprobacter guelmensis]MBM7581313.1 hypothetical protein [Caldicoprobacter guelmensis]